ncbi:hypothetical protein GCM10009827_084100 [Dactylosporangium maewongense]|uniref:Uncharacterized protein n=1 Tax=Dactylosporangium maewongense TaxID=634393 RepID=A0ABP4MUU6_9ACTN
MELTKAPAATRKPVLAIGQQMQEQAGRVVVTLQRVTAAAWTVTVYQGTLRIEDQCASFSDEVAAALTASAYLQLARAEQIAAETANPAAPLAQGEIREHIAGDVTIRIFQTAQAGILVQGRRNGQHAPDLCSRHDFDSDALRRYAELVAAHPAA